MVFDELNKKIEGNKYYQFSLRHKKIINILQGFFIIGLLVSINSYVFQDHDLKKQIADKCGYSTSQYECICSKQYAENWKEFNEWKYNLTLNSSSEDVYP